LCGRFLYIEGLAAKTVFVPKLCHGCLQAG
jgi:hypothetical protein